MGTASQLPCELAPEPLCALQRTPVHRTRTSAIRHYLYTRADVGIVPCRTTTQEIALREDCCKHRGKRHHTQDACAQQHVRKPRVHAQRTHLTPMRSEAAGGID